MLPEVISDNQSACGPGRLITDNVLIAYEISQYLINKKSGKNGVAAIKADMSKAYDRVEWDFLRAMLTKLGFRTRWIDLVMSCVSSVRYQIKVNRELTEQFSPSRGLRQGDPLSPLIFVLAADLLQAVINDAFAQGHIQLPFPCATQKDYPVIQYADDTILVLPACETQAATIKQFLSDYATSIGLKINFQKSTLIPINCDESLGNSIAQIFVCMTGKMPFTYLGLPLGTTRPSVQDLMPLVCKVERRLTATLNMISYGAKLSLVNSVITSLTIFALCTLKLPISIIELLDKIRRKCLWTKKTEQGESCNSLAAWSMICKPKDCGGLGILDLRTQSDALLLKYLHKFYNHWDLPSVELIWHTYYTSKIPHATDACGSFWWRDITKLMPVYRGITKVTIQDGCTTLLWKDLWMDDILASSHPRAFSYTKNEDISVQALLTADTLGETFHLPFSAQAHAELMDLQQLLTLITLDHGKDKWTCIWGKGDYTASQYYSYYFREIRAHQTYKWLWKSKVTMKIKVCGWLLLSDRLNTRNMLKRRH